MIQIGKYYKMNWYTKEKPQYGYFYVKGERNRREYPYHVWILDECNPWGGIFVDYIQSDSHVTPAREVPAFIAMQYIYLGKISYTKEK